MQCAHIRACGLITRLNMAVTFPRLFLTAGVAIDGDDPDHIKWILDKSLERASEFNITGITYRLTQGELKKYTVKPV